MRRLAFALAVAVIAVVGLGAAPVQAQPYRHGEYGWHPHGSFGGRDHEWRRHESWEHHRWYPHYYRGY